MKVLLTGASSFTGSWFARALVADGHEVTAIFRQQPDAYPDALRRTRVRLVAEVCRPLYGVSFGDDRFVSLLDAGGWDLLAHHAAEVTNYRSPAFDAVAAAANNTRNTASVVDRLKASGCAAVLLTGSVFERNEGAGSQGLPDFSPYGLSKAITAQVFRFHCERAGLSLGKFVIPNPFGPYEEPRYVSHLIRSWLAGVTPVCANPAYVRDNIHVSLLAKVYARFARELASSPGFIRCNPSGYAESQGAFTRRVADEMGPRLGVPCPVEFKHQSEFPEPRVRINTDIPDALALDWSESAAWDELARYYLESTAR